MIFIKLLVAVLVSYSALVCADDHFDDPNHPVHIEQGCAGVTTHEGVLDMHHGQFACQVNTQGAAFLRCAHGAVTYWQCVAGTYFNIISTRCEWEKPLNCINPIPVDCAQAQTSEGVVYLKHGQWACKNSNGSKFRRCWEGVMYDWDCPATTAMNTKEGKCMWDPQEMDCSV